MDSRMWLLSLAFLVVGAFASKCPPAQLIRPCSCSQGTVVCENIQQQSDLDGVFRRLGSAKVEEFVLKSSRVSHIPSSGLEKNQIQKIRVLNSTVSELFDGIPPSSNILTSLALDNITTSNGFEVSHLKPLKKLGILVVKDIEIPEVGEEFSVSLSPTIRFVALLKTKTRSIDNAFVAKTMLEDVRVQISSLTSLTRETFPYPAASLHTLAFDGNSIDTLPDNIFELMNKLIRVTLANNKITQVSESVFGPVYDQLKELALHGNPINCDCSIKWITERDSQGKKVTGQCAEPQAMAGKNIVDLTPSDFPDC